MSRLPNAGTLKSYWGKKDNDIKYSWGAGAEDGKFLHYVFSRPITKDEPMIREDGGFSGFLRELEERGYDLKTFKFEIKKHSAKHKKSGDNR